MYVPPGQGNAPAHPRGRGGLLHPRGQGARSSSRTEGGHRAETVLGQWDCVSCPADVIHGFTNVGVEARVSAGHAREGPARADELRGRRAREAARRASEAGHPRLSPPPGFRLPTLVGTSVRRKEDDRLLRGAGRYTDDFTLPGMLWMAVVRSPHAHARVARHRRRRRARHSPESLAVLTRDDLPECARLRPPLVPAPEFLATPSGAGRRARLHLGEGVAVVVADSAYVAADAVERVAVEYEPLPVAATPEAALARRARRAVHDDWPDNLAGSRSRTRAHPTSGFARPTSPVEVALYLPARGRHAASSPAACSRPTTRRPACSRCGSPPRCRSR